MDICVILGSKSDMPIAEKCRSVLEKFPVSYEIRVASAHRAPKYLEGIVENAEEGGCKVLLSIVQMPPGMPVATVGVDRGDNAGALAVQILATNDESLSASYSEFRSEMTQKVISDDESIQGR